MGDSAQYVSSYVLNGNLVSSAEKRGVTRKVCMYRECLVLIEARRQSIKWRSVVINAEANLNIQVIDSERDSSI